eukprot:4469479-Amphidinium_carterae.1
MVVRFVLVKRVPLQQNAHLIHSPQGTTGNDFSNGLEAGPRRPARAEKTAMRTPINIKGATVMKNEKKHEEADLVDALATGTSDATLARWLYTHRQCQRCARKDQSMLNNHMDKRLYVHLRSQQLLQSMWSEDSSQSLDGSNHEKLKQDRDLVLEQ